MEKTGNVPNLAKGGGGGTPPLVKKQTISECLVVIECLVTQFSSKGPLLNDNQQLDCIWAG